MGTRRTTSLASSAPAIRPKPQFSQQQMVEMKVVTTMACMLLWHKPAAARRPFAGLGRSHGGAEYQHQSHLHGEAQQAPEALGVAPGVEHLQGPIFGGDMEPMKTMMLRMMANRNASGSHRLTTRTQPLVNFLNTDSLSFILSGRGVPPPQFCPGLCAEQGRLWFYCIIERPVYN